MQPSHSLGDLVVKTFDLLAFSPRALLCCALAAVAALWSPVPTHGATVAYTNAACSSFVVSGAPPNQTVTCVIAGGGGGGAGVPVCTPTANPASPVHGQQTTISANCSNGPNANGYVWTGGGCGLNQVTTATCTDNKSARGSKTYTVSGSNASGSGAPAQITVTWQ